MGDSLRGQMLTGKWIDFTASKQTRERFLRLIARWGLIDEFGNVLLEPCETLASHGVYRAGIVWIDTRRKPIAIMSGFVDDRGNNFALDGMFVINRHRRIGIGRSLLRTITENYDAWAIFRMDETELLDWLRACGWKVDTIFRADEVVILKPATLEGREKR